MEDEEVKSNLRDFLYELNSCNGGNGASQVAVNVELEIPQFLQGVKCYLPEGDGGVYGDYSKEELRFLELFLEVMNETDGHDKPILSPSILLKIRKKALITDDSESCLEKAYGLAEKFGNVYFVNQSLPWQTENVFYNGDLSRVDSSWKDWESGTFRVGTLDNITMNLPRVAYEAKGDDDRLFERLRELLELSREALSIKRQIIEERICSDRLLPLFKEEVGGNNYLRLNDCSGIISYVGLPEAVQYHTGLDVMDSDEALKLSEKIVESINEYTRQIVPSMRLLASSITFEPSAYRLTNLDLVSGYVKTKSIPIYTEHSNLPLTTPIPLKKRLNVEESFQHITKGGHFLDIRLEEPFPTKEVLANYTKRIMETANIGLFAFTRDFTYCWHCHSTKYGFHDKCPVCGYDGNRLLLFTRAFGKIKPSNTWNVHDRQFATGNQKFTL